MIELASIVQALTVSEQLSFRGAARVLGTSQSAVSRRVRALEDELGVSLFERHSGGVRPTRAGRQFLDRARRALDELDHAVKRAGDAGRGSDGGLRIGIFASIAAGFAHDLLEKYSLENPGVGIDVAEGAPRVHIANIKDRRMDIAFVTGAPSEPGCDVTTFWSERVFVALSSAHPLAGLIVVSWNMLKNEHFVVSSEEPGPEIHDFIVKQLSELGRQPMIQRHDVGREALMILVGLGFGLSLISEAGTATSYPGVVFRPVAGGDDVLPFSAIWSPDNDNPALRRFLSAARVMARERRANGGLYQTPGRSP